MENPDPQRQANAPRRQRQRLIAASAGGVALIIVAATLLLRPPPPPMVVAPTSAPTAIHATPPPRPTVAPTAVQPVPSIAPAPTAAAPALAPFFDDRRFTYDPGFYAPQLQAYLDAQPGPLKGMTFAVGDRRHTFAETIIGQTSYYQLNPKVILALIETQSHIVSTANPSQDQLAWAIGFDGENGNRRGVQAQVRWAVRQMIIARRDYPQRGALTFSDTSSVPPPADMTLSEYMAARVLAPTTTPDRLRARLDAFRDTYTRLFGDPRVPPSDWPAPAKPFLSMPMEHIARVTSFFDHDIPLLTRSPVGTIMTYWGRAESDQSFAYDGHDGWDYALAAPSLALAAADGDVVFAGNADDNCATRAVVIDHRNGYRTLYWHLSRVDVKIGDVVQRKQPLGVIGESGCALGPHLHFGVQFLGRNTDPYGWCGGGTPDPWRENAAGTASVWLWEDRPSPCEPPPAGAVIIDTESPGFARSGESWKIIPTGYGGTSESVASVRGADANGPWDLRPAVEPAVAVYKPTLPTPGRYRVLAYVPYALNGLDDARHVRYRVKSSDGEAQIEVNQELYANDWIDLGTYTFAAGDTPLVAVSNMTEDGQHGVWADAVAWLPAP